MNARIIEKIKKAIALSRSSNEHEAAAALRQAHKLMQMHGITEAEADCAEVKTYGVRAGAAKKPATWEAFLATSVAKAFSCEALLHCVRRPFDVARGTWRFYGVGADAEIAGYAFSVLYHQAKVARKKFIMKNCARCKSATRTARADSFCNGWVWAALSTVRDIVPDARKMQMIEQARTARGVETVLGKASERRSRCREDVQAGMAAGKDARVYHGCKGGTVFAQLEGGAA